MIRVVHTRQGRHPCHSGRLNEVRRRPTHVRQRSPATELIEHSSIQSLHHEESAPIRIVSLNIHSAIGADGLCVPNDISSFISHLGPDIVCLQEVGWHLRGTPHLDQFSALSIGTGLHIAATRTKFGRRGHFGNATLCRWPIMKSAVYDLKGWWNIPRALSRVDVLSPYGEIAIYNCHLGIDPIEQMLQAHRVRRHLHSTQPLYTVLAGDFNDYTRAPALASLRRNAFFAFEPRSFPAARALLRLDKLFIFGPPCEVYAFIIDPIFNGRRITDHMCLVADWKILTDNGDKREDEELTEAEL